MPTRNLNTNLKVTGSIELEGILYDGNSSAGTNGQVLSSTSTGTDWVTLSEISGVDGTGTANYLSKWLDANTITNSLVYDNGTNVGIGTTSPDKLLHLEKSSSTSGEELLRLENPNTDGKLTKIGFITNGLNQPQTQIFGGNDNSGQGGQGGNSGAGKFKVTISNPSGTHQQVIYAQNDSGTNNKFTSLSAGGSEIMRLRGDGNVGIGTTNPANKLHVEGGNIQLSDNQHITWGYGGNNAIYGNNTSDFINIFTNGSERLRINASGQVGIGTTSPSSKLHLGTSCDLLFERGGELRSKDTGGGVRTITRVNSANELEYGWSGAGPVKFMGGGSYTERMRIHTNGNVGIGTTSPAKTLDIVGEIRTSGRATFNEYVNTSLVFGTTDLNLGYAGGTSGIFIKGSTALAGNVGIGTGHPLEKLHVVGTNIRLDSNSGGFYKYTAGGGFRFALYDDSSKTYLFADGDGSNPHMTFNAGFVGIGTENPAAELDVFSAASFRADVATGNPLISIVNNSAVSNTAGTATIKFTQGNTQAGGKIVSARDGNYSSGATRTSNLQFYTSTAASDTEKMRITSAGNVGIGTTSPLAKTHIQTASAGTIVTNVSHDDLIVENSSNCGIQLSSPASSYQYLAFGDTASANSGYVRYYHASNRMDLRAGGTDTLSIVGGNVGIGTTSPSDRLHIKNDDASGNNSRCDIRVENGLGYSEFGTLSGYARIQSNGTEAAAISRGASYFYTDYGLFGAHLTAADSGDGVLGINGGGGTGGEAYLKLMRANVSGFILNHTASAIQVRATANIPMFFYTNDTIGIKLNANSTVSFPEYGAGTLVTDASGNITVSSGGGAGGPYLPLAGGTMNSGAAITFTVPSSGGNFININHTGNEAWTIGAQSGSGVDDYLDIGISGGTRAMSWHETGRVGIGTTSPSTELHVAGDIRVAGQTSLLDMDAGAKIVGQYYGNSGAELTFLQMYNPPDASINMGTKHNLGYISFAAGNGAYTERMRIKNNGNVGIGTTNPTQILHVAGNALLANGSSDVNLYLGNSDYGLKLDYSAGDIFVRTSGGNRIVVKNNGNVGIGTNSPLGLLMLRKDQTAPTRLIISNGGTTNASTSARLSFYEGTNEKNYIERRRDNSGDFAFVSPADDNPFVFENASGEFLTLVNSKMGLGTPSPQQILHLNTAEATIQFQSTHGKTSYINQGGGNFHIKADHSSGVAINFGASNTALLNLYNNTTAAVSFRANGTSYFNGGNVGIGTTSPSSLLHIADSGSDVKLTIDRTDARTYSIYTNSSSELKIKDEDAGADRITIKSDGKVGINTGGTSLFNAFTVQGNANINNGDGGFLTFNNGDANITIHYNNADSVVGRDLSFKTYKAGVGNTEKMRITRDGNVGIGDVSPISKLHVQDGDIKTVQASGAFDGGTFAAHAYDVNGRYAKYLFGINDTTYQRGMIYERTSGRISIINNTNTTGMNERLTITTSGKVGIGTNNPTQYFEAFPDNNFSGVIGKVYLGYVGYSDYATFSHFDQATTSGYALRQGSLGDTLLNAKSGQHIYFRKNNSTIGGFNSNDDFYVDTDSLYVDVSANRVGIGTTSPSKTLEVNGTLKTASDITCDGTTIFGGTSSLNINLFAAGSLNLKTNNTTALTINSSQNVGIGTTSPVSELDVDGVTTSKGFRTNTSNTNYNLISRNSAGNAPLYVQSANTNTNQQIAVLSYGSATANAGTKVLVVGKDKSYFDNTNLGIGTSNPSQKLHVAGNIELQSAWEIGSNDGSYWQRIRTEDSSVSTTNAFNFETRNGSGSYIKHMVIRNDGNVGIGVTNPSYALQVGGSIVGSSKSFLIKHPTKEGKQLLHACIEGPEHGVYFRGKSTSSILEMPDYWIGLVHVDSVTVDITAIGPNQDLYVESIADDGEVTIGSNTDAPLNYFYVIYGERKDIDKLEIEIVDPEYAN